MEHYEACDRLGLPVDEQVAIGRAVNTLAHHESYSHALSVAKSDDVSPWLVFNLQRRLWSQVWRGGDVATFKLGPRRPESRLSPGPARE